MYAVEGHEPRRHRNPALVQAMTQLNMIDHLGYGIERMNQSQASRCLPLLDYDFSDPCEVRLTIYGTVADESYTRMLMAHSDLPFEDVLDRAQKSRPILRCHPAVKGPCREPRVPPAHRRLVRLGHGHQDRLRREAREERRVLYGIHHRPH